MIPPQIHIPFEKINNYLSFINSYRLNLEIYFSSKTLDSVTISDIQRLKAGFSHNPLITVHGPFMDLCPGAVDSKIGEVTIERFLQTLRLAEPLEPAIVVFHSGYEKWKYSHRPDIWLEGSLVTWKKIIEKTSKMDTKIAIENIFEDEPTNLRMLMAEMSSVTDRFGLCFDTGHFNLFSNTSLDEWLKELMPYIIEFHLHDNLKDLDSHLPITEGTFDFDRLFSCIRDSRVNNNAVFTIETHTSEEVIRSLNHFNEYSQRFLI
ncbi:MAG: sugar phosphate isomerase/epimerase [Nitrospirae bacterium]|nr:sugar phosphate isomerase/epimerase [Nitrospirota bacterium]